VALTYHPILYRKVDVFVRDRLQPIVDKQIRMLQLISDGLGEVPKCNNLLDIIHKLEEIYKNQKGNLTTFEVQSLCFHIDDLDEDLMNFFLETYLKVNWKPYALRGLMFSLLHCWGTPFESKLREIIEEHKNDLSALQKEAYKFMDSSIANINIALYIYNHNQSILDAPRLVLLNDETFTYTYFESPILAYFEKRKIKQDIVLLVEQVLQKHNVARFDKLLLAQVIIKANEQIDLHEDTKHELIRLGTSRIGDPHDVSYWQDDTLNDKQKSDLLRARQILRTWLIIRIIDNVFTKASSTSYPDRAVFWHKYAEQLLTQNDETRPFLRVISTSSLTNVLDIDERRLFFKRIYQGSDNTALLMRFGEYTLVELLEGGCMYIYKNNHLPSAYRNQYDYVWSNFIHEIDDLKDQNVRVFRKDDIMYRLNTLPENGRIAHMGDWQKYFKHFLLLRKIIIKN